MRRLEPPETLMAVGLGLYFVSLVSPWAFQTTGATFDNMAGVFFPFAWVGVLGNIQAVAAAWTGRTRLGLSLAIAMTAMMALLLVFPQLLNADTVHLAPRVGLYVGVLAQASILVGTAFARPAPQPVPGMPAGGRF